MKNKRIEQLKKQEDKIRAKINAIEEEEVEKKQKPRLKAMVGKCFVYKNNSYSCPDKQCDYWDVFRKVLDWVDTEERGFHFILEEFFVDRDGKVNLIVDDSAPHLNKEWWDANPFSGYVEISSVEYEKEKEKMLKEMRTQNKMRKALERKY